MFDRLDCNSINEYKKLSEKEKAVLLEWIQDNLTKTNRLTNFCTSYSLKHVFEMSKKGFYLTNGAFKGAMNEAGFKTKNRSEINWTFNVSKKSLALKVK